MADIVIDSSSSFSYGINTIHGSFSSMTGDLEGLNKTFQQVKGTFKVLKHFEGVKYLPLFLQNNMNSFIDFASNFDTVCDLFDIGADLIYWINPINEKTIDVKETKKSLQNALQKQQPTLKAEEVATKVDELFKNTLNQKSNYWTKKDFYKALAHELMNNKDQPYTKEQAQKILNNVEVVPLTGRGKNLTAFFMTFFTAAHLMGTALILHEWGAINLEDVAASVGGIAIEAAMGLALKGAVSIALVGVIIKCAYDLKDIQKKVNEGTGQAEIDEAKAKRTKMISKINTLAIDLVHTTAPLIAMALGTTLNPTAVIIMMYVSKSAKFGHMLVFSK